MVDTIKKRKPSRPSSITKLDPAIKEAVDAAVREGRISIDGIVQLISSHGGEASRSAVGRYVKTANERLEEYRQAQQMAAVWMDKIGKEPEGDVGRMLLEMLRMLAFKSLGELDSVGPEDLMFLTDNNVFDKNEYVFGVDGRSNVGFGLWQQAYCSKATLDAAGYGAARQAMMGFKNDAGKPLGIAPNLLLVGPSNEKAALEAVTAERLANGASNIYRDTAVVVTCPWLA